MLFNFLKYCPIYLLQVIDRKVTHFYLFMHFYGLYYLIKIRKIPNLLYGFMLIFLTPLIISLSQYDISGIKRCIITSFGITYSLFLAYYYSRKNLLVLMKTIVIFTFFIFICQYTYNDGGIEKKIIPGMLNLYRLEGPLGFSNHTGTLLLGIFLFFLFNNCIPWCIATAIAISLTLSRGSLLLACIGLIFYFLYKHFPQIVKYCLSPLMLFSLLSPYLIKASEYFLNIPQQLQVNTYTGGRYFIFLSFMEFAKNHFWGVGVDNAHLYFKDYMWQGAKALQPQYIYQFVLDQDPHNMFIKILCEHGVISYLIFCLLLINMYKKSLEKNLADTIIFVIVILGFCSLNGLNEWCFYLIFALYWKNTFFQNNETA